MNNRDRFLLGLVLICGLALSARAQSTIPPGWRTATTLEPAQVAAIRQFIVDNVAALESPESEVVRQAREILIERTAKPGGAEVSVAYANQYAEDLNAEALKLIARAKGIRPRLNVAIAIARTAENTRSTRLEPAILALLQPGQPEVVKLWGIRAGRHIVPALISLNAQQKLVDATMAAARAHPTGAMMQEAYQALAHDTSPNAADKSVEPLKVLVRTRIALYARQLAEDPSAEGIAFNYLTHADVWTRLPARQRQEVMQLLADVIVLLARHGDVAPPDLRHEIAGTINRIAQGGIIVFKEAKEQPAEMVFWKIHNNTRGFATVNLTELTGDLHDVISKAPGFQDIKPPPSPIATKAP
jgi:hypothetical protein